MYQPSPLRKKSTKSKSKRVSISNELQLGIWSRFLHASQYRLSSKHARSNSLESDTRKARNINRNQFLLNVFLLSVRMPYHAV